MRTKDTRASAADESAEPFHFPRHFSFCILVIIPFHSSCIPQAEASTLSIGTYNLWNVMFNWEMRLQHIADTIGQNDLDIVVFQEVRMVKCGDSSMTALQSCPSQLDEFRWLLPQYRWMLARPAGTVKMESSISDKWQVEGLGIISRRPIVSSNLVRLRQTSFRDSNKRIVLHVKVKMERGKEEVDDTVDVVVVHFSYDPQQQCDNANDIIKFINNASFADAIVLGDFNVYDEISPAIGQFVGLPSGYTKCRNVDGKDATATSGIFQDAWLSSGQSHQHGLSFSNMPTPGLQSRPDRILISKQMQVTDVGLSGNEIDYWNHYHLAAICQRARTILSAAYHSFTRLDGYSCLHDCGPHGSCRCGVCVKGGNSNNCHLPKCPECNGTKFIVFLTLSCIILVLVFILIFAVIRILVVSARFNQNDIMDILGYRCCLFNRQLYQLKFQVVPRKYRIRMMNVLKLFNLPPALAALASLVLLCFMFIVMYLVFQDALNIAVSVLPEEKFPSDHKMIFARVKV